MRKMRILALVLALALVMVAVTGCTTKPAATTEPTPAPVTEETAETTDAEVAEPTYTYQAAISLFPTNWNPHMYKTADDGDVLDTLMWPLYGYDYTEDYSGFELVPYMAVGDPVDVTSEYVGELWGIEEGTTGRAFRIALNPDGVWQDGSPITADDYVYSMKALFDPAMANYRAPNYYGSSFSITNARAYVYAGQTTQVENSADGATFAYDKSTWVLGEDGQYTTADGAKLWIGLTAPYAWMGGASLADYASYFQEIYDALIAEDTDGDGFIACTDANLTKLYEFTGSDTWGNESEDQLAFYTSYDVTYPEMPFENVGIQKVDEYTIDIILDTELIGFYIKYNLMSLPLVHEELYESCKVQDPTTGAWSSTYGTSVETTMSYGPYMLTKCMTDQVIEFERNPNWYGWDEKYADQFGTFERGIDGATVEQFQTDRIVWTMAADISTREQMFLKGQLDALGLNAELLEVYNSAETIYFTQGYSTFYGIVNSDYDMLLAAENLLNGGTAEGTPEECATPFKYNKTILSIVEFRQALCYCLDRAALCAALYPAGTAALSLHSNGLIADPANGTSLNSIESIQASVCDFWGVTYGEGGEFATVTEAYDAITGYDLDYARELVDIAVGKAIEAGLMTEDSIVRITYCAASASETETKWYNFFNDMFTNLFVGTKLEGKFQYDTDFTLGNEFGDKIQDGACDTAWGFGWSGSALDPYSLFEVYVDGAEKDTDPYQYDKWINRSEVELTLTFDGVEMTYNCFDWWQIINGLDADEEGLPNWQFGKRADADRAIVLGELQKAVLSSYTTIPLMNQGSVQLRSYKINYGREDYIYGLGYGGTRFMTYNFSDEEWAAYCAEQTDGILTY